MEANLDNVKKKIRAILISARNGLTFDQLSRDYNAIIGSPIPYAELGYRRLMDAIYDMPDVVRVETTGYGRNTILRAVPDQSSRHIANMVARQRNTRNYSCIKSTPMPQSRRPSYSKPSYQQPHTREVTARSPPIAREIPQQFVINLKQLMLSYQDGLPLEYFQFAFNKRFGFYVNVARWGFNDLTEVFESLRHIVKIVNVKHNDGMDKHCVLMPTTEENYDNSSLSSLEKSSPTKSNDEPSNPVKKKSVDELKNEIDKLLCVFPGGILLSKVSQEYKELFDEELPAAESSVLQLLNKLNDLCELKQLDKSGKEWLVCKKKEPTTAPPCETISVPEGTSKFLINLIKRQTCPVLVETLPLIYKKATNKDIPYRDYGYMSLTEMLQNIPKINVNATSEGRLITIEDTPTQITNGDAAPSVNNTKPSPTKAQYTSMYSKQQVPVVSSRALGVYVTCVKSPSSFCIQIIREDTTQALDSLHDDMSFYYNNKAGGKCTLKEVELGQPCCARFNNDGYWYRAEIVGFPQLDTVEVLYIDYGNKDIIPRASIRQPKPHYLSLPAQSITCRLANIRPPGPNWSKRSSTLLFEMTKDKAIAAVITNVSSSCVSVCLCDTTTDKDVHINDFLVTQGLAIFVPDTAAEYETCDKYGTDKPPAVYSSTDSNVRMPDFPEDGTQPVANGEKESVSQDNVEQMIALNSAFLSSFNPSLSCPVTYDPTTHFQIPDRPDTSVRPPPGFEGIRRPSRKESCSKNDHTHLQQYIKKVNLPPPCSLHILRHNNLPYVLSKEISSWLWDADLLAFHLKRSRRVFTVNMVNREDAPELFESLAQSNSDILWDVLSRSTLELYSLQDVPEILSVLKAPPNLLEVLKGVVDDWRYNEQSFWSAKEHIQEHVQEHTEEEQLIKLQNERTNVLSDMTHWSSRSVSSVGASELFQKFIKIDEEITKISDRLNKTHVTPANGTLMDRVGFSDCNDSDMPTLLPSNSNHGNMAQLKSQQYINNNYGLLPKPSTTPVSLHPQRICPPGLMPHPQQYIHPNMSSPELCSPHLLSHNHRSKVPLLPGPHPPSVRPRGTHPRPHPAHSACFGAFQNVI